MAQKPQIVDLTKSFLPGDPNSFVQNLVNTDREDGEEKTFPLLPYEGYNFLPTAYGYKSFFGTNSELGIGALASRAQFILLYQIPTFKSRLIALCEDGIWVATADGQLTVWVQVVTHTFDANVFEEWTWCVIENILYMYKQGTAQVYKTEIGTWTIPFGVNTPDTYQDFTVTETLTGDGSFPTGVDREIGVLYYQTTTGDFSAASTIYIGQTVDDSAGFLLATTGSLPAASDIEYIVSIYDDGSGITYVKQFPSLASEAIDTLGDFVALDVPSSAQSFVYSDQIGGDGSFDTDIFLVSVQYVKGPIQYFNTVELVDQSTPVAGRSLRLTITGAAPSVDTTLRVWLENNTTGDIYYKEVSLTGTVNILSLTECTLQGSPSPEALRFDPLTNDLTITSFVPSFLNMSGQMGIFKAGLRLGFWDSANSVSWSSNLDLADFTSSVENLAGNTIFGSVVGRIIHCRGHGEGFIVYSTKSIVGATFSATGNLLWDAKKILDNTGISFSRAVCCGKTDSEHFIFGTTGIYAVGKYNALAGKYDAEPVLVEVYDLLKESRDPVYMTVLQDRYLCFSLIDDTYINGKLSFSKGWANPYVAVVDWYVPSVTYPAPTEFLLPEQIYEIVRDEMSGSSSTKRKDGEWIPRYTTTVDRMDDRYYSFASNWIGISNSGLASYDNYSTYFNTIPVELTLSDINTYLNPRRPASPPDAFRYGRLYTQSEIRAFWGLMGVSATANNEAMLYLQEGEWDAFIRHQAANKTQLLAYSREVITTGLNNANSDTTVSTVIGTLVTGEGNNQWLVTDGPSDKAAKEVILRRTFNKGFEITKNVRTVNTGYVSGGSPNRNSYATGSAVWTTVQFTPPSQPGSSTITVEIRTTTNGVTTVASTHNFTGVSDYAPGVAYTNHQYGTSTSGAPVPSGILAERTISYNSSGVAISGDTGGDYGSGWSLAYDYTAAAAAITTAGDAAYQIALDSYNAQVAASTRTVTTTYTSADVTGSYGYSQFRALVTHWDRVKFGLYGDFEILETVAAETMTAKVWEGTYPSDLGTGRDQIWSYGQYKSLTPINLQTGQIGSLYVAANDPDGTALVSVTGFSTEGITSLHTSFTLPGASFLIQTGSIEAVYPTFTGAFVYDLHLKKWGKYKGDHKLLLETTPLNTAAFGSISYTDLGANAGIFSSTGFISLFDSVPLDSWIRFGKIGYYRLGMSNLLEIRASMRNPSDFVLISESSMDGKILDLNKNTYHWHYDEVVAESYMDISARWHTVKISGNFDLTGLEVRATLAGRR